VVVDLLVLLDSANHLAQSTNAPACLYGVERPPHDIASIPQPRHHEPRHR